jgi:hypothetical protein
MRVSDIQSVADLQDGGEVFFRIKSTATLKKLMHAYCDRQSVDPQSIAFLFDGRRLRAEQTPAEVSSSDLCAISPCFHALSLFVSSVCMCLPHQEGFFLAIQIGHRLHCALVFVV